MNLEAMLCGDLNRLRYITRFSTALVAHRETVAEHSAYVVLYSLLIGLEVSPATELDFGILLTKAAIHDVEEARTGDIYRPFKVSSPELKKMLHEASKIAFSEVMEPVVGHESVHVLYTAWDEARDISTPEGCIVAFADYLSVLAHMLQELRTANMTMREHYSSMVEYVKEFDPSEFDFLREYINQARDMVNELLGNKRLA